MAAEGITLPATTLKRDREQDLSDSFQKVRLEDGESRPTKQPKTASSMSTKAEAKTPATPEVEVSPRSVRSQTPTTQLSETTTPVNNKEGNDRVTPNLLRLKKAYWTEKNTFSGRLPILLLFHIFILFFHTSTPTSRFIKII